jgi:hypothetical protein
MDLCFRCTNIFLWQVPNQANSGTQPPVGTTAHPSHPRLITPISSLLTQFTMDHDKTEYTDLCEYYASIPSLN